MFSEKTQQIINQKIQDEKLPYSLEETISILSNYTNVHNHSDISNFRLTDSIIKTEDMVNYASELGYNGVALTDHEAITGHVKIIQHYEQLIKDKQIDENFKLILGNEIYLIDNMLDVTTGYVPGETKFWHFILLAKNRTGHKALRAISATAWDKSFRHGLMERVPTLKEELKEQMSLHEGKGNIIATTACLGGEFANLLLQYQTTPTVENKRLIHSFVIWCIETFGKDDFYIELQPVLFKDGLMSEQGVFNQVAVKIANAYGLKTIIATDSHYLKKEHRSIHDAYLSSDQGHAGARELGDFYATTYMWSIEDLITNSLEYLPLKDTIDLFQNTNRLQESIDTYNLFTPTIVPQEKNLPEFCVQHLMKEHYNTIAPHVKEFANSPDMQNQYFLYKCEQGLINKNITLTDIVVQRIDKEIEEIIETSKKINMPVSAYYVLVEVLVNKIMWTVSYIGAARGSITGFLTAYLMDITQVNPLDYDLPHWRHLKVAI